MTWNCEGLARNIYGLQNFISDDLPDLVFISEPQVYECDLEKIMAPLQGEYCYSVKPSDNIDPELPLVRSKPHGGVMALWKKQFDPYITVHKISSTSILPLIFKPPRNPISIHVSVYLPTHGQESNFFEELAQKTC